MPPFGGSPYSPGPEDRYDYRPGSAITDLILRAGDVRARQQERSGEIWGQTVAGLGQMAGGAIQDYQARKAEEEKARLEHERQAKLGSLVSSAQDPQAEIQDLLADIPDELKPQAFEVISKVKSAQSESAKRRREAEEHDAYGMAVAADALEQTLGTPLEGMARQKLFGLFANSNPEQVAQLQGLPAEQLRPLLQKFKTGSNKWTEEQVKIQKEQAETQAKLAEPGLKERQFSAEEANRQARLGIDRQRLALEGQRTAASVAASQAAVKAATAKTGQLKPLETNTAQRLSMSDTAIQMADQLLAEFENKEKGSQAYKQAYAAAKIPLAGAGIPMISADARTDLDRLVQDLIKTSAYARSGANASESESKERNEQIYRFADYNRGDASGAIAAIKRMKEEALKAQKTIDPTGKYREHMKAGLPVTQVYEEATAPPRYDSTDPDAGDPL